MTILSNELSRYFDVTLIVFKNKNKFFLKKKVRTVCLLNHNLNYKNFYQRIIGVHKIKKYILESDAIISDNIHQFTKLDKNIFIYANFFWEKIYNPQKKIELNLKKNDRIFSNYIFKSKYIKTSKLIKTPFFENQKKIKKNKTKILISFGTARFFLDKNQILLLKKNLASFFFKNYEFYLDPIVYDKIDKKKNISKAKYDQKMYDNTRYAIIKPGMGTVEECLKNNIEIISFTKNLNLEFKEIAKTLSKQKIGKKTNDIGDAFKVLKKIILNEKTFYKNQKLQWFGEKTISKYLRKFYS